MSQSPEMLGHLPIEGVQLLGPGKRDGGDVVVADREFDCLRPVVHVVASDFAKRILPLSHEIQLAGVKRSVAEPLP